MSKRFIPHDVIRSLFEKQLEPRQLLVLIALATYGGPTGDNIFPSEERIAYDTGYKRRNIINIIKELRELNILVYTGMKGKVKRYWINPHALPDKKPFKAISIEEPWKRFFPDEFPS